MNQFKSLLALLFLTCTVSSPAFAIIFVDPILVVTESNSNTTFKVGDTLTETLNFTVTNTNFTWDLRLDKIAITWNDGLDTPVSIDYPLTQSVTPFHSYSWSEQHSFTLNSVGSFKSADASGTLSYTIAQDPSISFQVSSFSNQSYVVNAAAVPEPEMISMFAIGLLGLGLARRKAIQA